ncbi:MAG: carboxylesterase family protein [Firmicutes bacterium]|nr:carboxylesterase family protein [Bacillota bacterium]
MKKGIVMVMFLAFLIVAVLNNVILSAEAKPVDIVAVEGGLVKGVPSDVVGVQIFKGIPFAGSTAGKNRWKAPQPVESWQGVKLCDTWGDQVMQDTTINPVGTFWGDEFYFDPDFAPEASEDGLNLNVYTPAKATNDKLPVFIWIHGGGNNHGYGSEMEFYASKLAEKGIIVVDAQYRVSMFGFLGLKELEEESPNGTTGNYALLDFVKALKWVNKYIAGFGGDASKITVGGQSAGAGNTTALLRSPLAKGLFQRAIIQSGFQGFLTEKNAVVYQSLEAKEAAIEKAFGRKMTLEELRAIPAEEYLSRKTVDGTTTLYSAISRAAGGWAIDGYAFTEESVDLMRVGVLDGYDIIIGGTSDEYSSLRGGEDKTMSMTDFAKAMQEIYGTDYKQAYKPSNELEAYRMYLRLQSDYKLQLYVQSAVYAKSHNNEINVYAYYFNHTPPGRNSDFYGSYHSSDLWYTHNSLRDTPGQRHWTSADYRMADTISSYWANFVKTGNPNGVGLTNWKQSSIETGDAFIRFHEGYAYSVNSTPYPERDYLNRKVVLESYGMSQ